MEKVEDAELSELNTGIRPTIVVGSFWDRLFCRGETRDAIQYWHAELRATNTEIQNQQKQHLDQVR